MTTILHTMLSDTLSIEMFAHAFWKKKYLDGHSQGPIAKIKSFIQVMT